MFNQTVKKLFTYGFILSIVGVLPVRAQQLAALEVAVPPLRIVRQDSITPLRSALTRDEEARDDEFPWYLAINKDEIIEIAVPCLVKANSANPNIETHTCYTLTTSDAKTVAVVNDRFLVGMAKRGEARITAEETVKTVTFTNRGKLEEKSSIIVESSGQKSFPLGSDFNPMNEMRVRIASNTDRKIISIPSLKTYKTVRDTYGKGIAKNFIVASVNIVNNNPSKQFLVQNVSVSFDPNQCNNLAEIWARIYGKQTTLRTFTPPPRDENKKELPDPPTEEHTPESERNRCLTQFKGYFKIPTTILPTDSNTMMAVSAGERYRSFRYRMFQAMRFAADVGGGLPAFNILGREGRTGFNFLGGTLFAAADAAIPDSSAEKRANLEKDVPKSNVIVKGNDAEQINIFIPAEHIFTKAAWEQYKKTMSEIKKDRDDNGFRQYLLLFLVADSNGILIDENSKQVNSEQGGGATTLLRP